MAELPKAPMLRIHEQLLERMLPDLQKAAEATTHPEQVDEASDELLALLRNSLPSWVAAPVLAKALHKLFAFNLEQSQKMRAEGLINPADPPLPEGP